MAVWNRSALIFLVSIWIQCSFHGTHAYLATIQCIWTNVVPYQEGPMITDEQIPGTFKAHYYEPSMRILIKPDSEGVPKQSSYIVYAITTESYDLCFGKCDNLSRKPAGAKPALIAHAFGMKFNVEMKELAAVPAFVWLAMKNGDTSGAVQCRTFLRRITRNDPTISDCWYVRSDNKYQWVTGIWKDDYYMIPDKDYNQFLGNCKAIQDNEAVIGLSNGKCFWKMDSNHKIDCNPPVAPWGKKTMRFQNVSANRLAANPAGNRRWKPPVKPTTRRPRQYTAGKQQWKPLGKPTTRRPPRQYPLGRNQNANKQPPNANAARRRLKRWTSDCPRAP